MPEIYSSHTLLTETDVSKQLRVSLAALRKWRVLNRGPKFVKMGPLVRYRQDDIKSWLGSRGSPKAVLAPEPPTR